MTRRIARLEAVAGPALEARRHLDEIRTLITTDPVANRLGTIVWDAFLASPEADRPHYFARSHWVRARRNQLAMLMLRERLDDLRGITPERRVKFMPEDDEHKAALLGGLAW